MSLNGELADLLGTLAGLVTAEDEKVVAALPDPVVCESLYVWASGGSGFVDPRPGCGWLRRVEVSAQYTVCEAETATVWVMTFDELTCAFTGWCADREGDQVRFRVTRPETEIVSLEMVGEVQVSCAGVIGS